VPFTGLLGSNLINKIKVSSYGNYSYCIVSAIQAAHSSNTWTDIKSNLRAEHSTWLVSTSINVITNNERPVKK